MTDINELVLLSAPGLDPKGLREMAEAIESVGFPQVLVTNEEFKVIDLDKLERQLEMLLKTVKAIKEEKRDIAIMERAERIRKEAVEPHPDSHFNWGDSLPEVTPRPPAFPATLGGRIESPAPPVYKGKAQREVIARLSPQPPRRQMELEDFLKNMTDEEGD